MKFTLLLVSAFFLVQYAHAQHVSGIDPNVIPTEKKLQTAATQDKTFVYVEQMPLPTFDINVYLSKNLHYPDEAKKSGIQGRVIAQFVVNEDGSVSNCKVIRGIGGGCDEEALRVLKNMPLWKPGKQGGKAVKVLYTQPVTFKLSY